MIEDRVRQLEAVFRGIAATRMADLAVCHPQLDVRAIGFELSAEEPEVAWGVLLTPWFMNLLRLPLQEGAAPVLGERESATRSHGGHAFEFLGAFEPALGAYESCSLFSPMFDFADQATAEAMAREVLALLRAPAGAPSSVPPAGAPSSVLPAGVPSPLLPAAVAGPSRRGLLFGRGAAERRP